MLYTFFYRCDTWQWPLGTNELFYLHWNEQTSLQYAVLCIYILQSALSDNNNKYIGSPSPIYILSVCAFERLSSPTNTNANQAHIHINSINKVTALHTERWEHFAYSKTKIKTTAAPSHT